MNIFKGRPLCLSCFFFISAAIAALYLPCGLKMVLSVLLLLSGASLFAVGMSRRSSSKTNFIVIISMICIMTCTAFLINIFVIERDMRRAEKIFGDDRYAIITVTSGDNTSYSSEYSVKILSVDGIKTNLDAKLLCSYPLELEYGDTISLKVAISEKGEEEKYSAFGAPEKENIVLVSEDPLTLEAYDNDKMSFEVVCGKIRSVISEYFSEKLGSADGGIVTGLLTGERDGIPASVLRDFRRSGVYHLLSVSGLHFSVIVGALGFLLSMLRIRKGARCVILSVFAFLFLMLTGFSVSASRSMIMLLAVYFSYLLSSENDALTALFAAAVIILIFSPYSVGDIGLWLSFFATFGILTFAPVFSRFVKKRTDKIPAKGKAAGFAKRVAAKIIGACIVTVSAEIFICFIIQSAFGEISLMSVPANLLISPVATVILVLAPVLLVCGNIPFIGSMLIYAVKFLTGCMTGIAGFLSESKIAVVSLKYRFAFIIIILMSLCMAVMLVVKLKNKSAILIPPAVSALGLTVCFAVTLARGNTYAAYVNRSDSDMLVLCDNASAVICDISDGHYGNFSLAYDSAREMYATEIGAVVLTHYHSYHISSIEYFSRNAMLRSVFLPIPENEDEYGLLLNIVDVAQNNGVSVNLYRRGEELEFDRIHMEVSEPAKAYDSDRQIFCISVTSDDKLMSYIGRGAEGSALATRADALASAGDIVVFGMHGPSGTAHSYTPGNLRNAEVVLASPSLIPQVCLPPDTDVFFARINSIEGVYITEFE